MDLKLEKVAGHPYSKVLDGAHKGEYVNQTKNKRDGEFFKLVEKAGRMQHVYGTGKDREVLTMPAKDAAAKTTGTATPGAATQVSGDAAAKTTSSAGTSTSTTTSDAAAKTTPAPAATKTTSAASTSAATDTAARLLAATGGLSAPDQA